jgi:hypothetical protein
MIVGEKYKFTVSENRDLRKIFETQTIYKIENHT